MSQAKVMTIALNRFAADLNARVADLPFDEKVAAYLAVVRKNETSREGLAPAMTECARTAILRLYGVSGGMLRLDEKVLTNAERLKCYARRNSIHRAAFEKWFNAIRPRSPAAIGLPGEGGGGVAHSGESGAGGEPPVPH